MSNEGWRTLRVALVCVAVVSVIYGNAKTIDLDEFVKSSEIIGLILTIAFGGKVKGLFNGMFSGKDKEIDRDATIDADAD